MPPASSSFTPLNVPEDVVPEWLGSFTLAAPPNTDLWRKPPSGDVSTAPILYTALRNPFIAAEVTVSADWELEWDQGGLVIFAGSPPGQMAAAAARAAASLEVPNMADIVLEDGSDGASPSPSPATSHSESRMLNVMNPAAAQSQAESGTATTTTPTTTTTTTTAGSAPQPPSSLDRRGPPPAYPSPPAAPPSKWVKVGLEFCNNACHATSVVANSEGADWSLSALPPHQQRRYDLRVKIERIGYALWVWYEDEMLGWKKLREVTWFFWGVEDKAVRVGVYASRPANFGVSMFDRRNAGGAGAHGESNNYGARNLCVDFEGLEIF